MKQSWDQGFSLLELMIVVLVMALVLGVTYPSLSRGSSAIHLRATARDILSTFRYAREKAVTEQTAMLVTVSREKQELVLSDDFGGGSRKYALPPDVQIEKLMLAETEVTEGPVIIRFLPNGSAENAQLLLKSNKGSYLRIITDPITGGARVEPGAGENVQ